MKKTLCAARTITAEARRIARAEAQRFKSGSVNSGETDERTRTPNRLVRQPGDRGYRVTQTKPTKTKGTNETAN